MQQAAIKRYPGIRFRVQFLKCFYPSEVSALPVRKYFNGCPSIGAGKINTFEKWIKLKDFCGIKFFLRMGLIY